MNKVKVMSAHWRKWTLALVCAATIIWCGWEYTGYYSLTRITTLDWCERESGKMMPMDQVLAKVRKRLIQGRFPYKQNSTINDKAW